MGRPFGVIVFEWVQGRSGRLGAEWERIKTDRKEMERNGKGGASMSGEGDSVT